MVNLFDIRNGRDYLLCSVIGMMQTPYMESNFFQEIQEQYHQYRPIDLGHHMYECNISTLQSQLRK
jgi:hypothetical protein